MVKKNNFILIRLVHLLIRIKLNQQIDVFSSYLFTVMHELFDITMKRYGIQAKALSNLSGVSQNHISEFRSGKLKTGVTTDCLYRLLVGMDELSPGSRRYFCDLLAGKKQARGFEGELEFLINAAEPEELEIAMIQILRRVFPKDDKKLSISTDVENSVEHIKSPILR